MSAQFTAAQLAEYNGENGKPIYISVKGVVYDCTAGADFYGVGKAYHVFAGREASRPLGKMQISADEANAGWANLSAEQQQTLNEWADKFKSKYPVVGTFVPDPQFEARGNAFPV